MSIRIYIITFLLFLTACGSKPIEPKVPIPHKLAETSFQRIESESKNTSVELTGAQLELQASDNEIENVRTGEAGWVTVEHTMPFNNNVSPGQAKQSLLEALRNKAISLKIPPTVEVSSLLSDMMGESNGVISEKSTWSGFFKITVSGVITAEEILLDGFPKEIKNGYEKTIKLKAFVEPVTGQRDPSFFVEAHLENNLLKTGDELSFSITASQNCYLYVFNLMADQNIMLLFPNKYLQENFITAETKLEIPDAKMRKHYKFKVGAMPGESLSSESIYIVCTKSPVKQIESLPKIGESIQIFSHESQHFLAFQRWLTNIPLDQRIEMNLMYHVSKN